MKTKRFYFSIILIGLLFFSCEKQDELSLDPSYIQLNEKAKQLVNSSATFGIDLFKATLESEETPGNLMISPYSVSTALCMAYNGASGDTKTAMENALRLNGLTMDEVNINYKQLTQALVQVDPRVSISIANSIWYRHDFPVLPDFIQVNHDFYDAAITSMDFELPGAKDIINNWVASKTNNRITEIVDQIDPEIVMFLINAIYFKGTWKYTFDKKKNNFQTFYLSNGTTKQVEMMNQTCNLAHFSNSLMSMAELPYGQGNWAMDLILPNPGKTIGDVINELNTANWNTWVASLGTPSELIISIPPYKFDYDKTLNDILSGMGMALAFDPYKADFSKISELYQLYISTVKHKTFIEVNEEGTEAAAVTSVEFGVTSAGLSMQFNKPFLFVIREVTTGAILFMGKVENPER